MRNPLITVLLCLLATACVAGKTEKTNEKQVDVMGKAVKSDAEWRECLTPEQYKILRKEGTEPAFSNEYWDNKDKGAYKCAGCGAPLFSSEEKYKSGTGWPSFWSPINKGAIDEKTDRKLFTVRTEVHCEKCGGHLGHAFNDGPKPTGMRYCINSAALAFVAEDSEK